MRVIDSLSWRRLAVVAMVATAALLLRTVQLSRRPVHNDEANQAWKARELAQTGRYRYDPHEHHGPTLYYLTLPFAWLEARRPSAADGIAFYRLVPGLAGTVLALLALAAWRALGGRAATAAALLTAVSPALVYYSRFFIQEMLLATFTATALLSVWHYTSAPSGRRAALVGVAVGLMQATKETWILEAAAFGLAMALGLGPQTLGGHLRRRWRLAIPALLGAGTVSVVLYSSFFTWWRGPLDSLLAYATYLGRGTAESGSHQHPFGWYASLLLCPQPFRRLCWGEELIVVLALWGILAAWVRPVWTGAPAVVVRVLSLYALTLTLLYSAIPYKTPWCLVTFWHVWVLLAGAGVAALLAVLRGVWLRLLTALLLSGTALWLARAAWQASTRYAADPRNPYVYAQTGTDFLRLVQRLDDLRACAPEGDDLAIYCLAPPDCTWPLPWHLRRYRRAGYWTALDPLIVREPPAILVTTPTLAEALPADWPDAYVQEFYGLRPEVLLAVFIRRDLWDRFMQTRAAPAHPPS